MKRLGLSLIFSITAVVVGCAGSETPSTGTGEAEATSTERGFELECETEQMFISEPTTKVIVTKNHLQITDDYGEQIGWLDAKAKTRRGWVGFDGYETGMDCSLSITAEKALLDGKPGKVQIDCSGDDMISETLTCSNPKPATLEIVTPDPPPPPDPSTVIPADAKTWDCNTTDGSPFSDKLTMRIVDGAIALQDHDDDIEWTGTRDRDYTPVSGSWIQYDNVEYGGDCAITLVVGGEVLKASTTSTILKVRCSGDSFEEARYSCETQTR